MLVVEMVPLSGARNGRYSEGSHVRVDARARPPSFGVGGAYRDAAMATLAREISVVHRIAGAMMINIGSDAARKTTVGNSGYILATGCVRVLARDDLELVW